MKKQVWTRGAALLLTGVMLGGCGSTGESAKTAESGQPSQEATGGSTQISQDTESSSQYPEELTVDVFASEANYQGMQSGWFAKIVKDRFNMDLNIIAPNVAGGGDTLFQTRSAAGDLGDLIICKTSNGQLAQLVKSGLVIDLSPYLAEEQNIKQYQPAIDSMKSLSESAGNGVYAIPTEVSTNSPTTPSTGLEPNYGPYLRWDYYKEIGYPEMNSLDDLLDVLSQMQAQARKDEGTDDIYALSLFKDWDRDMMTLARNITCFYGYDQFGLALLANDGSETINPVSNDSVYEKALHFLYEANQLGLVDPDSTTQNYDTMYQKMQSGKVLFSFWSWMGQGAFNTPENTAAGKGFKLAPVSDMKIGVNGCRMLGYQELGVMIGSKADDPQRLADFIDWLYSPEGIMANQASGTSGTCGPEDLTWTMENNEPVLTDFGKQALGGENVDVPEEWGGGTWSEGVSALNTTFVNAVDTNPLNGEPYMYALWKSTIRDNETALDADWKARMNADSATAYLQNHGMFEVAPGDSYVTPEEDSQITTLRSQCGTSITDYSWRLAFAEDENAFNSLYAELQKTLDGLNFNQVFEYDKTQCEERVKAREKVTELYNSENGKN